MSDLDVRNEGVDDETDATPGIDEEDSQETVPKEHYDNLLTALKQERGRDKVRKAELATLRDEVDGLKNKKVEEDAFEGLEDDDAVPVSTVKKLLTDNRSREVQRGFARDIQLGERLARATHDDYSEIVNAVDFEEFETQAQSDPAYMKSVLKGDQDPLNLAEHVYQTLKARKADEKKPDADEPEDGITEPVKGPKTMSTKSRGGPRTKAEKYSSLTLDQKRELARTKHVPMEHFLADEALENPS